VKPKAGLAARALDVARNVAVAAFGPKVQVRAETSSDGWHETLHRHLFEQQLSVWTSISNLDVIADGAGNVIGFVDHEAYRRADDTTVLGDDEVLGIVADNEFLPPRSRVLGRVTYPGPEGGRLEAVTVEGQARQGMRRWLVEINMARRLVASIRPLDGPGIEGEG
jgi:hypothetical protein